MKRTSILCLPVLALLALTTVGCSAREKAYCDKLITCEGGNDADKTACVNRMIQATTVYGAYNCGEAWSKFLDCIEASAICNSGNLSTSSCKAQDDAAESCKKAASANGGRTIL